MKAELEEINVRISAEWIAFQRTHKMIPKPATETPAYLRKQNSRFWTAEDWARQNMKDNAKDRNKS